MAIGTARIDGDSLLLPGGARVRFMRTLRLPEQGTYGLPPGLGCFPLRRVEDYPDTAPREWLARGGVMLPVYLREAMWLSFSGTTEPAALQVGVGKVCAVSGKPWSARLSRTPQNYVVLPRQPWLDGINSGKGTVRQFVAVPLGLGATVEGQVTGEETWGGLQLQSFGLSERALARWRDEQRAAAERAAQARATVPPPAPGGAYGAAPGAAPGGGAPGYGGAPPAAPAMAFSAPRAVPAGRPGPRQPAAMGLGVGGSMRQEVYRDGRPAADWATEPAGRVFVHMVTPPEWRRITGEEPPATPADRAAYTKAGLPWFDYYDEGAADLAPTDTLGGVKPVGDWIGDDHEPWQDPTPGQTKHLGPGKPVADGDW